MSVNYELIIHELKNIEREIKNYLKGQDNFISQTARSYIITSGKRLRPSLVLFSAGALGKLDQKIIKIASAVEIIHLASLLHDDVIDEVKLRRGELSLNAKWNNKVSILLADFLLTNTFYNLCREEYIESFKILSKAMIKMSIGQLNEIKLQNNLEITLKDYLEIIQNKTAALFSAACEIGALFGKGSPQEIKNFTQYGLNLGTSFQIIDDILDFWGKEEILGKPIGNDLRQKNFTLPLIYTLKASSLKDRTSLKNILNNGKITSRDFSRVLKIMQDYKTKEYTFKLASQYSKRAISYLDSLKDNQYKQALFSLAQSIPKRAV